MYSLQCSEVLGTVTRYRYEYEFWFFCWKVTNVTGNYEPLLLRVPQFVKAHMCLLPSYIDDITNIE